MDIINNDNGLALNLLYFLLSWIVLSFGLGLAWVLTIEINTRRNDRRIMKAVEELRNDFE
jgi:hypothetical protein